MPRPSIKHRDLWDCTSPTYGHGVCVQNNPRRSGGTNNTIDDEESTAYSPRSGAHFMYPSPRAIDQPPVAVVIPPGNSEYRTSSYGIDHTEYRPRSYYNTGKWGGEGTFATDAATVATHPDRLSPELSDDDTNELFCDDKRRLWLLIGSMIVLVAGILSIGLGVGLGVRKKNNKNTGTGNDNSKSIPSETSTRNSTVILVGAYYYPWHGSNFHNGDGYIRSQLDPPQFPALGEYDDTKPETISQHLKWSRQANIGLWVTSWWGPDRLEDTTTRDVIMEHEELGDMKISIHYETTNRVRDGNMENVESDIHHMCEHYFDHDSYYKIDGRPVIFVYVSRKLESDGHLEQTIVIMRSAANRCGKNIFIVGDHVFNAAPDAGDDTAVNAFFYFDAVTNYDMYGSMGSKELHAGSTAVTQYYADQKAWKDLAAKQGCRYMPTVSPGFNDRGVRLQVDHQPLSRSLTADSVEGSLFAMAVAHARRLLDPTVDNLLLVNSFNEWHEDTQIEPCAGVTTYSPEILTGGLDYEGYGELYLNILKEGTTPLDTTRQAEDNIFQPSGN